MRGGRGLSGHARGRETGVEGNVRGAEARGERGDVREGERGKE